MTLTPHTCTTACALLTLAGLFLAQPGADQHRAETDAATVGQPAPAAFEPPPLWRGVRVGHDWVEPRRTKTPATPARIARSLIEGDDNPLKSLSTAFQVECQQPGCRNCQWMRLFGGEW